MRAREDCRGQGRTEACEADRQEEAARGAQEAVGERLRVALGASAGAAVRLVANLQPAGEARERGARVKGGGG